MAEMIESVKQVFVDEIPTSVDAADTVVFHVNLNGKLSLCEPGASTARRF